MRVLKYTCELNKLLIIACITAISIMGFGKLINLGPVIGTYALLWLIKENCSLEQFYEWANIGFLIGLNAAGWAVYFMMSISDLQSVFIH